MLPSFEYRREERKRHEEAVAKAAADADERVRAAEEEARKEREGLRRVHDKQVGGSEAYQGGL